jgi:hypothetical protein
MFVHEYGNPPFYPNANGVGAAPPDNWPATSMKKSGGLRPTVHSGPQKEFPETHWLSFHHSAPIILPKTRLAK